MTSATLPKLFLPTESLISENGTNIHLAAKSLDYSQSISQYCQVFLQTIPQPNPSSPIHSITNPSPHHCPRSPAPLSHPQQDPILLLCSPIAYWPRGTQDIFLKHKNSQVTQLFKTLQQHPNIFRTNLKSFPRSTTSYDLPLTSPTLVGPPSLTFTPPCSLDRAGDSCHRACSYSSHRWSTLSLNNAHSLLSVRPVCTRVLHSEQLSQTALHSTYPDILFCVFVCHPTTL